MVGSVGMARSVPRPNSLVIQEALNLLAALGGDKKGATKELLTEMKSIQDHNESVLADAKKEVVKANEREALVLEEEAELSRSLIAANELHRLRLLDITNGEMELQRNVDNAAVQISKENGEISLREDQLRLDMGKHDEIIGRDRVELAKGQNLLNADREDLNHRESAIKGSEDSIKSDRATLDSRSQILDKFKLDLDNRDTRLRAAMEG